MDAPTSSSAVAGTSSSAAETTQQQMEQQKLLQQIRQPVIVATETVTHELTYGKILSTIPLLVMWNFRLVFDQFTNTAELNYWFVAQFQDGKFLQKCDHAMFSCLSLTYRYYADSPINLGCV
ncbi:uncharacterized protein LOC126456423 [Schistocerca serialis cubense]|uniref:uncharacterized protein LOC126456423 n=1 Tax=Schistocerca serialis cubense TaxID=2023355 RepID=UPI00214EB5EB|nr:uncharacterized protein LOC126456423 [Schistocerca serialis cubense]